MKRDQFTQGYFECALWSSTTDDGTPMDSLDNELADDAIETMTTDCEEFQTQNEILLERASEHQNSARQGHDFWLTRNGHGAGFWDGDYPEELGTALTKASKLFGECNLYVGDDGKIYIGG